MAKLQKFNLQAAEIVVFQPKQVQAESLEKARQALKGEWKRHKLKSKKVHFSIREA